MFFYIGAEEFSKTAKDLTGDKTKDDLFYHGLWEIYDSNQDLTYDASKTNILFPEQVSLKVYVCAG